MSIMTTVVVIMFSIISSFVCFIESNYLYIEASGAEWHYWCLNFLDSPVFSNLYQLWDLVVGVFNISTFNRNYYYLNLRKGKRKKSATTWSVQGSTFVVDDYKACRRTSINIYAQLITLLMLPISETTMIFQVQSS